MTTQFKKSTPLPTISVVMATYNGEKYIRKQLESLAHQTLLPLELVITDDGSTDATLEIVGDFARSASFNVRIFQNEARLGYADNFLKAATLSRGDLIAFCDQDDIWMENKLLTCSEWFKDGQVSLVVHSARTITDSGAEGNRYPDYSLTRVLNPKTCDPLAYRPGFAMVIRRYLIQLYDNRQRPPVFYGHDNWCWFLAACTGRIVAISEALSFYRQHKKNLFGAPVRHSLTQRAKRFANVLDYSKEADLELDCAHLLREAAKGSPDYSRRLEASAKRFELRSRLHSIRNRIYRPESGMFERARAFMRIVLLAGYLPGRSKTRLGARDAIKDTLLGVLRCHRLLTGIADLKRAG